MMPAHATPVTEVWRRESRAYRLLRWTSIADALRAVSIPAIEVHLSNLYARDSLRHTSVTGVACAGIIMGLGTASYLLALRHLATLFAAHSAVAATQA